jgi:hypothetical protein
MKKTLLLILLGLPLISGALELDFTPEESALLEKGELVVREQREPKEAWPVVTVYKTLASSPEHSMAIFAAYDDQKNYVPNVVESTPIAQPSPRQTTVAYRLEMPWPVGEVRYTHEHRLSSLKEQKGYRLDWNMIESTSTDLVEGYVVFLPHGENKSLMAYSNRVRPKSIFGGMVRGIMVRDLKRSLSAITEEIEKRYLQPDDEKTQQYLVILRDSLNDKFRWVTQ